ncbi:MAG: ROK family protein [Phycisphaerales bacterium]
MAKGKPVIGIDLGGTNMQIGVVSADHKVIGRSKKKTRASEGAEKVMERMYEAINEACAEAKCSVKDCAGLGIGAPGAINPHKGMVVAAPNLRWYDYPLADVMKKKLGIPVVVDNDVNVAVYGEHKLGAGRGCSDFIGIWLGTGVGGGIVLNNQMYYGGRFSAGEIGHTILFPFAPPGSQKVEDNCSRTAIVDRLLRLIRNHKSIIPQLADGDLSEVRAKTVAMAYEKKDKVTHSVIHNAAELIGIAAANAVTLLSLQKVVLGGGLSEAMGSALVKAVRDATRKYVFPQDLLGDVDVVLTELADNAGLLGAAIMAREKYDASSIKK